MFQKCPNSSLPASPRSCPPTQCPWAGTWHSSVPHDLHQNVAETDYGGEGVQGGEDDHGGHDDNDSEGVDEDVE